MNSKLYYEFLKELNKAEEELKVAKNNWKLSKTIANEKNLKVAECKSIQWQKAVNLLYLKG
ncbi:MULTISPECIES: hypothetical protein [Clostridium]|uniref:Uncharacterized protein n=2 Tax=Clostridium TaxID=1485 RepID=A0A7X5PCD2_CLOSG|nr:MULTISPECIES: hypothetical protein [Clostridium]AJD29289.1 hypothetical protein T258_3896 [Clostridium botulinum Prevot_594]APQ78635.1 hypothetical protein RSJ10_3944 [Clostridium botulinum]KEI95127.1 hypothetical protein N496_19440 [Clostridium botulinum A2B3 87]KIS21683.1 hypothetical protein N495_20020 [Clostridium botulinum B2 450]MBN3355983.1 hypothetical protein [Clostridium botulinum]